MHGYNRDAIADAQIHYKEQANRKRIPAPEFPIDSEVFVLAKHIKSTRPTEKFSEKYLGPFKVIERSGSVSYKLQLPDYLRRIHPVFHVSQLEPVQLNSIPNRVQTPPPPIEVDGEEEYEVEDILNSRYYRRQFQYLVKWKGYTVPTWELSRSRTRREVKGSS